MGEHSPLLTEAERQALELRDIRQHVSRARAVEAMAVYATTVGLDGEAVEAELERIREMSPKALKRLRKQLVAVTELTLRIKISEQPTDEMFDVAPVVDTSHLAPTTPEDVTDSETLETSQLSHDDSTYDHIETDSSHELAEQGNHPLTTEIHQSGLRWAKKLLGDDYDFEHIDARTLAEVIYDAAGSFQTRRQKNGKKIDPISRISKRLRGMTDEQIAEAEGYNTGSVGQWFYTAVSRNINLHRETSEIKEQSIPESEQRFIPSPSMIPKQRMETIPEVSVDHAALANVWADKMKLSEDDREYLVQVLDPRYMLELSGTHKNVRHHFRLFMKDMLPELEDSDLQLDSNEIVRLNALFGRVKIEGEYKYQASPLSAFEVIQDNGYVVPQRRNELLMALQKLHDYMSAQTSRPIAPEELKEVSRFERVLRSAGYSDVEVTALEACVEFDEKNTPKVRPPESTEVLKRLQGALVENIGNLDSETDKNVIAALRMLTNTAFGQKTVRDIYYKLHGKDASVTQDSVTAMLKDAIIKLIS